MSIIRLSELVPGKYLCCVHMDYVPIEDLFVDANSERWNVCKPCALREGMT